MNLHYLLFYEVVPDYAERQNVAAHQRPPGTCPCRLPPRGELVLGGTLANPVDGAVLLFRGESPPPRPKPLPWPIPT